MPSNRANPGKNVKPLPTQVEEWVTGYKETKKPWLFVKTTREQILHRGLKGLRYLAFTPIPQDDQQRKEALIECLKIFAHQAIPLMEENLDQPVTENFIIILEYYLDNYFQNPGEASYTISKLKQWQKDHHEKIYLVLDYCPFRCKYWDHIRKHPGMLFLLEFFFRSPNPDIIKSLRFHTGEEAKEKLDRLSLPLFFSLMSQLQDSENGLFYDFEGLRKKVFKSFMDDEYFLRRKRLQNVIPLEGEKTPYPYDIRGLSALVQDLAKKDTMPGRSRFILGEDVLPMTVFPIDPDAGGIEFLKHYIRTSHDKRWQDAADVVVQFLTPPQLKEFILELEGLGNKEKSEYLQKYPDKGTSSRLLHLWEKHKKGLAVFPEHTTEQLEISCDAGGDWHWRLKEKIEEQTFSILAENWQLLRTNGKIKSLTAQTLLRMFRQGALDKEKLSKLAVLDLLADSPDTPDHFFLDLLTTHKTGWIGTAALHALQKRQVPLPDPLLRDLLEPGAVNPFTTYLSLNQLGPTHKTYFKKIQMKLLAVEGTLFQERVLKIAYRMEGYKALKDIVNSLEIDKLSPASLRFFLQKAYESKDAAALWPFFQANHGYEIVVPVMYALVELDRPAAVKRIIEILRQLSPGQRPFSKRYQAQYFVEHLFAGLFRSRSRGALPLIKKLYKEGFYPDQTRDAWVVSAVVMNPGEMQELEKEIQTHRLIFNMLRLYQPEFLPFLEKKFANGGIEPTQYIEALFRTDNPRLIALAKKALKHLERKAPPLESMELMGSAFLDQGYSKRKEFMADLFETKKEEDIIDTLIWCTENGDRASKFYALRYLLNFKGNKAIEKVMKQSLSLPEPFMHLPAIFWFARQKNPMVLPHIREQLQATPMQQFLVMNALYNFANTGALEMVISLIEKRCYHVWHKIDVALRKIAIRVPGALESYLEHPDMKVRKKVLMALKGHLPEDSPNLPGIRMCLSNPDTGIAVAAFEALANRWESRDLEALKALYRRVKAVSLQADILAAIAGIKSSSGQVFMNRLIQGDDIPADDVVKPFVRLYRAFDHTGKLVNELNSTDNINLFARGLSQLKKQDIQCYLHLLFKKTFPARPAAERFAAALDNAYIKPAKKKKVPVKLSIKIPEPIKTSTVLAWLEAPPPGKKDERPVYKNAFTNYTPYGFLHWHVLKLYPGMPYTFTLRVSADLKKWSAPLVIKEPMRTEEEGVMALENGDFLFYYLRCKDHQSLYLPRPYLVPVRSGMKKEPGYFPLGSGKDASFDRLQLFRFKKSYYLLCMRERTGENARGDECSIFGDFDVFVFTSGDLQKWQSDSSIQFPPGISGSVRVKTIDDKRVFLLTNNSVYFSGDLKNWSQIHGGKKSIYYPQDILPYANGYCVVSGSMQSGFVDAVLSFSRDLKTLDPPFYTGLESPRQCAVFQGDILLLYGDRVEKVDIEILKKDTDRDGLHDVEEAMLLLDKNNPDTDGDGIPDGKDLNPLRKPAKQPTETMKIRQAVIEHYMQNGIRFGMGGVLIIVSEGAGTQSYNNLDCTVLSLNPRDYEAYETRVSGRGNYFRIFISDPEISDDQKDAVVNVSYFHSGLASARYRVILKKENGQWKVIEFRMTMIS